MNEPNEPNEPMKIRGAIHDDFVKNGVTGEEIQGWMRSCGVTTQQLAQSMNMSTTAIEVENALEHGLSGKTALQWMDDIIKTGLDNEERNKMDKKFCPECQKEGRSSTIRCLGQSSTLMGYDPFYDEQGIYHIHDPNIITRAFKCSNEHQWEEKSLPACPAPNCEKNAGFVASFSV